MADNPSKVTWIILGSIIGTVVGIAITPLVKYVINHFYSSVGIKVSGPKTRIIRRK